MRDLFNQEYSFVNLLSIKSFISEIYLANNLEASVRFYSDGRRPGFFANILENIKSEYGKNKEMQDSLKKFREEAQKLEESEALKEARRKFESIEGETSKGSNVIKEQFTGLADKAKGLKDKLDDVEALKRASEIGNNCGNAAHWGPFILAIKNFHYINNHYHNNILFYGYSWRCQKGCW